LNETLLSEACGWRPRHLRIAMNNESSRPDRRSVLAVLTAAVGCGFDGCGALAQSDPLPSRNDGAAKRTITDFVARVTTQGGAEFVPPAERIAVFDNDGTLWCEQPEYFQALFAFDRVRAMAPQYP